MSVKTDFSNPAASPPSSPILEAKALLEQAAFIKQTSDENLSRSKEALKLAEKKFQKLQSSLDVANLKNMLLSSQSPSTVFIESAPPLSPDPFDNVDLNQPLFAKETQLKEEKKPAELPQTDSKDSTEPPTTFKMGFPSETLPEENNSSAENKTSAENNTPAEEVKLDVVLETPKKPREYKYLVIGIVLTVASALLIATIFAAFLCPPAIPVIGLAAIGFAAISSTSSIAAVAAVVTASFFSLTLLSGAFYNFKKF